MLRAANDARREKARSGAVLDEQTGNRALFSFPDVGNRRIEWRLPGAAPYVRIGPGLEQPFDNDRISGPRRDEKRRAADAVAGSWLD